MSISDASIMQATVITPEAVEWQGDIVAVESQNSEGPFSIMPDHTRFITIISGMPITFFLSDEETKVFNYEEAVLVVDDNSVTVYVHNIEQ